MQWLAICAADGACDTVAIADRSALALADALLAAAAPGGSASQAASFLMPALRHDGPLLLWAVCRGSASWLHGAPSFEEVANHLARELRTPGFAAHCLPGQSREPADSPARATWGIEAVHYGEICHAAEQAAREARLPAEQVDATRLLALLHAAPRWVGAARAAMPAWLAEACSALANAESGVSQQGQLSPILAAVAEGRACAAAAKSDHASLFAAWCVELPEAAGVLRRASEVAARLVELEEQFAATLQREKLEAMAELAAGAGHEMNNPLAVISGRAQLLLRGERDAERRRDLALINGQALRVHEMISDLMLFARPPLPRRERVDGARLARSVAEELAAAAAAQSTTLSLDVPGEAITLHVDAAQLSVALRALVHNALESLERGGQVTLAVRSLAACDSQLGAESVEFRVADDGPGLTDEARRHLFDPFFSGRAAGRGLGMGLSKCWRIVTMHGGQIAIESAAPRGVAARIVLPLLPAVQAAAPPAR